MRLFLLMFEAVRLVNGGGFLHRKYAAECVSTFVDQHFNANTSITVLRSREARHPGFEIESMVLGRLGALGKWLLEVTSGKRIRFESYSVCLNCDQGDEVVKVYKRHFQPVILADYYVLFAASLEELEDGFELLRAMRTYNVRTVYLVYYYGPVDEGTALTVVKMMWEYKCYRGLVLLSESLEEFTMYGMRLDKSSRNYCGRKPVVVKMNRCYRGVYQHVHRVADVVFQNCTVRTLAIRIPPFVVDHRSGIEMEIVRQFGRKLGIDFEVDITTKSEDWGEKENGSWSGRLGQIYRSHMTVGVGGLYLTEDRVHDFDYTDYYCAERIVWIVPPAMVVPKSETLITIFSLEVWLLLIGLFVVYGCILYGFSRVSRDEFNFLKSPAAGFAMSLQLIIGASTKTQPRSHPVRTLYLFLDLCAMIISCYYQSFLIDALTNPRFYDQIDTADELYSSKLQLGGIRRYRNIFNYTDDMDIYNAYQVHNKSDDNVEAWTKRVASGQSVATLTGLFYATYLVKRKDPVVTNRDLSAKIYVIDQDVVFRYAMRTIFSKGFPFRRTFNNVIKGLLEFGLVRKWIGDYTQKASAKHLQRLQVDDDGDDADGPEKIEMEDIQGVLALLLFGALLGAAAFLTELAVFNIRCTKKFKTRPAGNPSKRYPHTKHVAPLQKGRKT